jgi:hypothetical protein
VPQCFHYTKKASKKNRESSANAAVEDCSILVEDCFATDENWLADFDFFYT